jgi:hypothetical protein
MILEETGKHFDEQESQYKKFNQAVQEKLAPVSELKASINRSVLRKSVIKDTNEEVDEKEIVSLKAADGLLLKY